MYFILLIFPSHPSYLSSSSLLLLSNSLLDVPQAANQASTTITQHPVSTWVTLPHFDQTAANCHASALFFSLVADDNRLKQGADYPSNLCPRDCSHALFLRIHGWLKKNAMRCTALLCWQKIRTLGIHRLCALHACGFF